MVHFVLTITYTAPLEQIDRVVAAHRTFLQAGYDRGWLLLSGPQNPRTGGIIIGRAPSLAEAEELFRADPYQVARLATYAFTEFNPVKRQAIVEAWCSQA